MLSGVAFIIIGAKYNITSVFVFGIIITVNSSIKTIVEIIKAAEK